ncbi:O-antigen ligase family protein [Entomohabitans teleogrylli]|uniref:O-antigen ligase family protein n=1 Tax=Entomohabitans teleogrylli TaxID=1384589 RepID=UPI00073D8A28|nr:O-antigen ligase family protein [Entomohabitans teleogrylli]
MLKDKNDIIYNACVVALATALALNLIITGIPAKIFYIVSYISVIFTIRHFLKEKKTGSKLFTFFLISIFLVGLVRVSWALYFNDVYYVDVRENYLLSGKRALLATFVIFWLYTERFRAHRLTLNIASALLIISLFITCFIGYYEYMESGRIKLTADAATTSSYLITVIGFATLWTLIQGCQSQLRSIALCLLSSALMLFLLALTETRSAILSIPVFLFIFFAVFFRKVNKKVRIGLMVCFLTALIATPFFAQDRMKEIAANIQSYHHDNSTSIGARFSIWKGGWYSTTLDFLGQSPDSRTEKARLYIEKYEKSNPEAYNNVKYNLHNELLEVFSLQGIAGLITLLSFYIIGLIIGLRGIKDKTNGVFFIIAPVIMMGLTDSVLIQANTVMVVCISAGLAFIWLPSEKKPLRSPGDISVI